MLTPTLLQSFFSEIHLPSLAQLPSILQLFCTGIFLFLLKLDSVNAYSIGDVGPRALRGVWRLTSSDVEGLPSKWSKLRQRSNPQQTPRSIPMKEFTTYPQEEYTATKAFQKKPTEIFIKLKENYTFEQCTELQFSDGKSDEGYTLEDQLELELSKRERASFAWKGTWGFIDGKLILAADRPEKKPFYDNEVKCANDVIGADTILVGRVAVQLGESLMDNPAVERRKQILSDDANAASGNKRPIHKKGKVDVHLSVPNGKIKVGKFMYPKDHPYFFDQPIICPQQKGSFELKQILGEFNAKLDDEAESVELFQKKDLGGKRFYLTTFPLRKRRKKFEYWSKEDNCYKIGEYEPTAAEKAEEELEPGKDMQVMAVELFANNTFSTLYGLGNATVLRGKWSIIGEKRDQLWMMVLRFGWGRSVSGSTFSEGKGLTQEDEKGYWGEIKEVPTSGDNDDEVGKKVMIKGRVIMSFGMMPWYSISQSVGRFKMTEIEDTLEDEVDGDEDEDEEYEALSADVVMESALSFDSLIEMNEPAENTGAFE